MLEIEPTGQHGWMATRSGQNVLEAENLLSPTFQRPSKIELLW